MMSAVWAQFCTLCHSWIPAPLTSLEMKEKGGLSLGGWGASGVGPHLLYGALGNDCRLNESGVAPKMGTGSDLTVL